MKNKKISNNETILSQRLSKKTLDLKRSIEIDTSKSPVKASSQEILQEMRYGDICHTCRS